jgi:tetratricopeptide (TPR) repeat protein
MLMTIGRDPDAAVTAASALWGEPERAEALLLQAMDDAPESETVLIALYRFYFYRGELSKALALAERCIEHAARDIGIDPDWRQVVATDIDFGDFSLPRHRFYLFSLNAYGYLLARLGRMEDSENALSAVMRLDPNDRIGSGQLLGVVRAGPDQD